MLSTSSPDALLCLRALSIVLDLANGLREDKSLATALFAHRMAEEQGLSDAARTDAFYAALLRHLGCTSYAHREAELFEDDVLLRRALATADGSEGDVARAVVLAHPTTDPRASLARLSAAGPEEQRAWTHEACGGAHALAASMGFGDGVTRALEEVFERHDGRGAPRGLSGEAISLVGRIANVAHLVLSRHTQLGPDAAVHALQHDTGIDPQLAQIARTILKEHPDALLSGADDRLRAVTPMLATHGPKATPRTIAEAFGDFADLQSKHTRGHARSVGNIVEMASPRLGLTSREHDAVTLAAHLHDVGAAAVPTRIWETRDRWSEAMKERARMHVYYTERALSLAQPFAPAVPIAGAHHERLDAGGYHRGLGQERISLPARLLAAADVFHALREDRPHRAARTRSAAKDELVLMARGGALDVRVVEAVVAHPSSPRTDGLSKLTEREREVLRHVAAGLTNKEIASALQISDRTVQTHTLNVYEKLGVTTRAAAAILASRSGLLERA